MSERTTTLARQAAEAIRELNHLTYDPGGLSVPDAYTVIAELATMAYRLDQLLGQLAANLNARNDAGGLRLDFFGQERYDHPADAIHAARDHLSWSAELTRPLATKLEAAQNITAHLADTGPTPGGRQ